MAFTNFNSNDFAFFTGEWTQPQKKALRKKIGELEEAVYEGLPVELKENLSMSKVGKIYSNSKSIWFSFRPIQYSGADNINYNFDLYEKKIIYCLNSETKDSKKLFKKSINSNENLFLTMVNHIPENKIWIYERNKQDNRRSNYNYYQEMEKIKKYEDNFTITKLNELFIKIDSLTYSAVRIGKSYSKNESIAIGTDLPNLLIQMTIDYFKLFKFLNNL